MKPSDETINDFRGPLGRDPLIGARIDDYEVQSVIGEGAMGIVYRVQHAVIGKPAALKVLKPDYADDPEMVQRLVREARSVNAIRHPGIVDVFGFGTLPNGQPYIVMDLLEGEPLDVWVKREAPASFVKVAPILEEVLSALHAAHQVGVIHRDMKPGNVFVESHPDSRSRVKIIDFGLARQADRAQGSVRPTSPGTLIGTPAFMAPEQVLGTKVFPATDLYAVGGIAYQMLTGRIPHEAPSAIEVISQKMRFDPVSPRHWVPDLGEDIDSWVMMLLDREPERRPESADDARRMLRRLLDARSRSEEPLRAEGRTVSSPPFKSGPTPGPKRVGSGTPKPQVHPGVVPKRQWGDAKTVLVEPVSPVQPLKVSDSSVTSTDPEKPQLGAATVLTDSGAAAAKNTFINPPALPPQTTQPAAPVAAQDAVTLLKAQTPQRQAPTASVVTQDGELARSKLPFIVVGLVIVIVVALAVLIFK